MECVRCVCAWLGRCGRRVVEWMRGLVWALPILWEQGGGFGRVSVFGLLWCGWCRCRVCWVLGPGSDSTQEYYLAM